MADHEMVRTVAARQHGLVSRRQLADGGMTPNAVAHAVRGRRLEWLSPRVLRLQVSADTPTTAMAAVLDASDAALALVGGVVLGVPGWGSTVHVLRAAGRTGAPAWASSTAPSARSRRT